MVLSEEEIKALATKLKQVCGRGGTVKDGVIEIQGEHREKIADALVKFGYKVNDKMWEFFQTLGVSPLAKQRRKWYFDTPATRASRSRSSSSAKCASMWSRARRRSGNSSSETARVPAAGTARPYTLPGMQRLGWRRSVQLAASHVPTDVLFVGGRDRDGDRPNGDQVTGH